jgi:hypothetical protein
MDGWRQSFFRSVPAGKGPSAFRDFVDRLRGVDGDKSKNLTELKAHPLPEPQKRPDYLTCKTSPHSTLNFTKKNNPFEPGMTISGMQERNGRITGRLSDISGDGKPYTVRTGEPSLASDTLEHETLSRLAKQCRDTMKP